MQGRQGVELSGSISGLELPASESRYDSSANIPGAALQDVIEGRRQISAAVNILGDTPAEVRKNKRKWLLNHPKTEPGKLWFFTSDGMPRYLYAVKSESAGSTSLDKDPAIRRLYESFEWGWNSDQAHFRGYRETKKLKPGSGGEFFRTFYNPSTVEEVFPTLYLPGSAGGRWRIKLGFEQPHFVTPVIAANEEIRLDFDPSKATFVKRNLDTGEITNLWPTMMGERPRFSLERETKNTFSVTLQGGNAAQFRTDPRLVFTPLFTSWN